jgi:hypothetical protein
MQREGDISWQKFFIPETERRNSFPKLNHPKKENGSKP